MEKFDNNSKEQRTWDKILLAGWRHDTPCSNLQSMFLRDFDDQDRILAQLRRCPVSVYGENKMHARRFAAAYLPVLSEKLWNGESEGDIMFYLFLHGSKLDCTKYEVDARKARRDRYEVAHAAGRFATVGKAGANWQEYYESKLRSNQWGVVK